MAVAAWALGCNPVVTPLQVRAPQALTAAPAAAEVVWLLDTSGSMLAPEDPMDPACPMGCGTEASPCPAACPTRQDLLVAGLQRLTAGLPGAVGHSVVLFPNGPLCAAPSTHLAGVSAAQVAPTYAAVAPAGGTPTAAALRYAATLPVASHTERLVVLVTDGIPNCNPDNPNHVCAGPANTAACRCTTNSCAGALCALGCVDDLGVQAAGQALEDAGHRLMVVALGADFAASAAPFSTMRVHLQPRCDDASDCGGAACGADGQCEEQVFRTETQGDFDAPALRLTEAAVESERCTWWLGLDVTAAELEVTLGGTTVPPSQWTLWGSGAAQRVRLSGAACAALVMGAAPPTFARRLAP